MYVYDGAQCLGSLIVSIDGDEGNRYALLSTDGSSHTIKKPADGTALLTFVYSPLLTEAPPVNNGEISIPLAEQDGQKAHFVAYATLGYNDEGVIANTIVPFKFATSVIRAKCTGLNADIAITSATLSNVDAVGILGFSVRLVTECP